MKYKFEQTRKQYLCQKIDEFRSNGTFTTEVWRVFQLIAFQFDWQRKPYLSNFSLLQSRFRRGLCCYFYVIKFFCPNSIWKENEWIHPKEYQTSIVHQMCVRLYETTKIIGIPVCNSGDGLSYFILIMLMLQFSEHICDTHYNKIVSSFAISIQSLCVDCMQFH